MLNKIRIKNLRSLVDTNLLDLRPLTILVGTNSSGKSSFLRVFPLLKQSAETRTGSGLLLNEPYVDYGIFPTAVRDGASPKEIAFEFELDLRESDDPRYRGILLHNVTATICVIFAARSSEPRYSYLKYIELKIGTDALETVKLEAKEDGSVKSLFIDTYDAEKEAKLLTIRSERGLIPKLVAVLEHKSELQEFVPDSGTRNAAFTQTLINETDWIFHGKTLRETRTEILRALRLGSPEQTLEQMRRITDNGSWNSMVNQWKSDSPKFLRLRTLLLGDQLPDLLSIIGSEIVRFSQAVHYFEPIRARVQRDYVSRDVQVENVEPDGRNVAMFLSSLEPHSRGSFEKWIEKNFGFIVTTKGVGDGSRVALRFRESGSLVDFNLVDIGFGYSQILPILVQIWAITVSQELPVFRSRQRLIHFTRDRNNTGYLVAIEQPELHLHPALQAKMADLLAQTIILSRKESLPIRFVVETHSQTIIDRIGQLIEASQLEKSTVQVLLFEKKPDSENETSVRAVEYSGDGVLQEWPYGFFESKDPPKLAGAE